MNYATFLQLVIDLFKQEMARETGEHGEIPDLEEIAEYCVRAARALDEAIAWDFTSCGMSDPNPDAMSTKRR